MDIHMRLLLGVLLLAYSFNASAELARHWLNGNNYSAVVEGTSPEISGSYTTDMSITGFFVTDWISYGGWDGGDITDYIKWYEFNDGRTTLTSNNSEILNFYVGIGFNDTTGEHTIYDERIIIKRSATETENGTIISFLSSAHQANTFSIDNPMDITPNTTIYGEHQCSYVYSAASPYWDECDSPSPDDAGYGINGSSTWTSAVPVPAALWLFGSGLGLLGWMRRKPA